MPRSAKEAISHAEELADRFEAHDPQAADAKDAAELRAVRLALKARADGERRVAEAVAVARGQGHSWAAIGAMLGTTGEAARQRYSHLAEASMSTPAVPTHLDTHVAVPARGAPVRGDDYQFAWTLLAMLRALRGGDGVHTVQMEQHEAGPFDDLVLRRTWPQRDKFMQIKSSNVVATTLNDAWFTGASERSQSPLERFFALWGSTSAADDPHRPEFTLIANRTIDPGHPVLSLADRFTGALPVDRLAIAGPRSMLGKQLDAWGRHLATDRDTLCRFLSDLRIEQAPSESEVRRTCKAEMAACGLRSDDDAVAIGIDTVRGLIKTGRCELSVQDITALVRERGLVIDDRREVAESPELSADAVIRGPIEHLGLGRRLAAADDRLHRDPIAAANEYGAVADAVEASAYAPHGGLIRAKQVEAFRVAGDHVAAAYVELATMARAVQSGHADEAIDALGRLRDVQLPDPLVRSINAVGALAAYEFEDRLSLEGVSEHLDALRPGDAYRAEVIVLFGEYALADERSDLLIERVEALQVLANSQAKDVSRPITVARLGACIADATGEWSAFSATARGVFPPSVTALVLARHARFLARSGEPDRAIDRYLDAIERGTQESLHGDVADWLYALRLVRVRYGLWPSGDINDLHRLAMAFRAQGNRSVLPESFSARERALARLVDQKLPEALKALRFYARRAVALGAWADEAEAHGMRADVFRAAGQPQRSISHLVVAGKLKESAEAAGSLPEEPFHFRVDSLTRRAWERACSYEVVVKAGDLIPDSEASKWVGASLDEIRANESVPFLTPSPSLSAWKAFAALAMLATEAQAAEFLSLAEPLVEREPNHYRHTDDAHIDALIGVARAHTTLEPGAVDQLCGLLTADGSLADRILGRGSSVLRAAPDVVALRCGPAAQNGNVDAARALIAADTGHASIRLLAEERLSAVLEPRVHEPGRRSYFAGWGRDALFVRVLGQEAVSAFAKAMCAIALDHADVAHNRQLALEALIPVSGDLAEDMRAECYEVALQAARGAEDGSVDDGLFPSGPLSRWQINFGPPSLRPAGVRAAAALARTSQEQADVTGMALECLAGADDNAASAIVQALSWMPASADLDVRVLAAHPLPAIRGFAAYVWCTTGASPVEVGAALGRDRSAHVRRTLAHHLGDNAAFDHVRATLMQDVRRSVRAAVVDRPA